MTQAQLIDMWGFPDYYDDDINVSHRQSMDVIALADPVRFFLVGSSTRSPAGIWATPSGVYPGMPESELHATYGDRLQRVSALRPQFSAYDSPHHYYLTVGSRGLGFAIDRGRVTELLSGEAGGIDDMTSDAGTAIP